MKLLVEVEVARVEGRFQDVFRDFQKAARLPGFREGKAPADMIEKKFFKEAHEEVLKVLIPEAYHQAIVELKASPISLPTIADIQMERGKKLTFSAEFDSSPEVHIKNYKGIRLKREPADVREDDVEKGMQSLLESRADLVPVLETRPVQKGDFVVTDIEIWKDGQYVPGKKGVLLFVEPSEADDFYDKVLGANLDELREISSDFSEEEKKSGLVGRKPHYKIWVRGIKEKKLPALDDAFAKGFGKENTEALREAVRKDIASYKQSDSMSKMKNELYGKLLTMASFPVPEPLVAKQKERLIEQARRQMMQMGAPEKFDQDKEKFEQEAARRAEEQVRLYFILQKIADEERVEVDEFELEQRLRALADESKRPLDEARRVFEDDLRESMREAKTVDLLIANAKFEEPKT